MTLASEQNKDEDEEDENKKILVWNVLNHKRKMLSVSAVVITSKKS